MGLAEGESISLGSSLECQRQQMVAHLGKRDDVVEAVLLDF
jgi:hypothetical protein